MNSILGFLPLPLATRFARKKSVPAEMSIADFPGTIRVKEIARGSTCRVYRLEYPREPAVISTVWEDDVTHFGTVHIVKIYASDHHALKTFRTESKIYKYMNGHGSIPGDASIRFRAGGRGRQIIPMIRQPYYPLSLETLIRKLRKYNGADGGAVADLQVYIAYSLMMEIEKLHRFDITHCDIKPGNILLNAGMEELLERPAGVQVAICDYGFSRIGSRSNHHSPGTEHYSSPEATRGDKHLTYAADWWSFGCTVFELVTGVALFDLYSHDGTVYEREVSNPSNPSSPDHSIEYSPQSSEYSLGAYSDEEESVNVYYQLLVASIADSPAAIRELLQLNGAKKYHAGLEDLISGNVRLLPETRTGATGVSSASQLFSQ